MAHVGEVHVGHGVALRDLRGEAADAAAAAHGDDHSLGLEDVEFAGAVVDAHGADDPGVLLPALGEQVRHADALVDLGPQTAHFLIHHGLDVVSPDAEAVLAVHVVGKEQLGLLIPPHGILELVVLVPDLYAPLLQLLQGIPAFHADHIPGKAVGIAVRQLHGLFGVHLRGDLAAGIAHGAVPVIDAHAALAAVLGEAPVRHGHGCPVLQSGDGGPAAGNAAAQHQHIRLHHVFLLVVDGIRPLRHPAGPGHIFLPDHRRASFSCRLRSGLTPCSDKPGRLRHRYPGYPAGPARSWWR